MLFTETQLKGAYIITPERIEDERGFFARTWDRHEFEARGLNTNLAQCNISYNTRRGTLRGMHYQATPHEETKLVRCTSGAIYDVIIDLRPGSPTLKQWLAIELRQPIAACSTFRRGSPTAFKRSQIRARCFIRWPSSTPRTTRVACDGTTRHLGLRGPKRPR